MLKQKTVNFVNVVLALKKHINNIMNEETIVAMVTASQQ